MAASDVPESSTSSRSADLQLLSDHSAGSEFPATQQQKRKRQPQTAFRSSNKGMIASVKEFFECEKITGAPILFGYVIKRTAEALQVSPASVKRVGSEMRSQGFVSRPAKLGRKSGSGAAQQETDNFLEGVIRRRIHRFYTSGELPTMEKLLLALQEDVEYPFGRTTLYATVRRMGFRYKRQNKKVSLYEQHRIIAARHDYLRKIQTFRSDNRMIVYLDETWLNTHHIHERCWLDYDGRGGIRVPSGKGGRLIILHAGSEHGWILNAALIFRGEKGSGDYHDEMNTKHFMEWYQKQLLPHCPPKSVIVLDNAKYHNGVVEKVPTKSSTKKDIMAYLDKHSITYDKQRLKSELFMLLQATNPQTKYLTDVLSNDAGHDVLRLPVGHCELNPIELVWVQVKGYAADHNKDFTMRAIEQLAREGVENVTATKWKKCVDHVNHYRTSDGMVEQAVESLVIEVGAEDSSDSEEILLGDDENDNND